MSPRKAKAPPMPMLLVALREAAKRLAQQGVSVREWARRADVPKSTLDHWLAPTTRTADLAPLCRALKAADVDVEIRLDFGSLVGTAWFQDEAGEGQAGA